MPLWELHHESQSWGQTLRLQVAKLKEEIVSIFNFFKRKRMNTKMQSGNTLAIYSLLLGYPEFAITWLAVKTPKLFKYVMPWVFSFFWIFSFWIIFFSCFLSCARIILLQQNYMLMILGNLYSYHPGFMGFLFSGTPNNPFHTIERIMLNYAQK